jgi:hypothetical protein
VRDRLDAGTEDDVVQPVFDAVERLITENTFSLGDSLGAEFIEVTWDHPRAAAHMGPVTRERARLGDRGR